MCRDPCVAVGFALNLMIVVFCFGLSLGFVSGRDCRQKRKRDKKWREGLMVVLSDIFFRYSCLNLI